MNDGRENAPTRRTHARPRLFISYRRRFDVHSARLLKNELARAFGDDAVFRDVDDIEAGEAFPEAIREAVELSDVFLLLVSPGWLESIPSLHNPEDFVRREIAAALARQVLLIPVLLGEARMPKADELPLEIKDLAFRQAIELSDERWDFDVARLVKLVRARAGLSEPVPFFERAAAALRTFFRTRGGKAAAAAALLAAVLLAFPMLWRSAIWYQLRQDFEGCVGWHAPDVLGGSEKVASDSHDIVVVRQDRYKSARDEKGEVRFIVWLTDSGKNVGAVLLRFSPAAATADSSFTVEKVLAPPCQDVQDYFNSSRPANAKQNLKNWDTLAVRLGERDYLLRPDDRGEHISVTFVPAPAGMPLPWKK